MLGKDLFVTPSIEERPVKLADGSERKLPFCKVSSFDWQRFVECLRSQDPDQKALSRYVLIAASLCDLDGKPSLSLEKAKSLNHDVADSMFAQALSVNNPHKKAEDQGNG